MAFSEKNKKMIRNLVAGMTRYDAYKAGGGQGAKGAASVHFTRILNDKKCKAYYDELSKKAEDDAILTRNEGLKILTEIAKGDKLNTKDRDKIRAINEASKMQGWNEPEQLDVNLEIIIGGED